MKYSFHVDTVLIVSLSLVLCAVVDASDDKKQKKVSPAVVRTADSHNFWHEFEQAEWGRSVEGSMFPVLPAHSLHGAAGSPPLFDHGTIRSEQYSFNGTTWDISLRTVETLEHGLRQKYYTESYSQGSIYCGLHTYSYDTSGAVSEVLSNLLDQRTIYIRDSLGRLTEILTSTLSGHPIQRTTYSYDENGFLVEYLAEVMQDQSWTNSHRRTYTNDTTGNALSFIGCRWLNGEWANMERRTCQRDQYGDITEEEIERWISDTWTLYSRYTYQYNTEQQVVEMVYHMWINNSWTNSTKTTTTYDQEGDRLQILWYTWTGGSWMNIRLEDFTKISGSSISLVGVPPGTNYPPETEMTIRWIAVGITNIDIHFSPDSGLSWSTLVASLPDTGDYVYSWTAPDSELSACKLRVSSSSDAGISSENQGTFSILESYSRQSHNTGLVEMTVFDNGVIGDDGSNAGRGFRFKGKPDALYSGGLYYGTFSYGAVGMTQVCSDLENKTAMAKFHSDASFDQISSAVLKEKYDSPPMAYGVEIQQETYSRLNDSFVICSYTFRNVSGMPISSFYVGLFLDWDIGYYGTNLGGYDVARNLAYQYDGASPRPDSSFYGVVALSGLSGARVEVAYANRQMHITNIMSTVSDTIVAQNDYRTYIGAGPFSIPASGAVTIGFAVLAGENLDSLKIQADRAFALWNSGLITSTSSVDPIPLRFSVGQNYPNPFNPETSIPFELPSAARVRITIYDLLGRQVISALNEELPAGRHIINLDLSSLSSGVYLYRVTADSFTETRKMVLTK